MDSLGWALIHFLWQGALIALALAVGQRMLLRSAPRARYGAACVALLLMALCIPVTIVWIQGGEESAALPGIKGLVLDGGPPEPSGAGWQPWVVGLWALGATMLLLRTAMGWWLARTKSRNGIQWDYPLSRLMERMNLTGSIDLMVSRFADAPQVFGWLKPVILVPTAAIANLTPGELEAVLAHELAHIIRRDYLVNLIQTVVESLLFYHPAVWWVSRSIRQEREHCCDDIAVKVCGDRRRYSRALLKLEESRPAFAMAATAGGMKMRITRLLGYPVEGSTWGPGVVATGAILLLGGLIWASQPPVPAPPAPPEAPVVAAEAPAPPAAPKLAMAGTPAVPAVPVTPAVPVEVKTIDGVVGDEAGGVVAGAPGGVVNGIPQPPQSPSPAAAPQPAAVPDASPAPPPPPPPVKIKRLTDAQRAQIKADRVVAREKGREIRERARQARMMAMEAQSEAQSEAREAQAQARIEVKLELEKALKELQLNKQQLEVDIREAVEKAKLQLSDVNVQKEAHASMEKAMAELKAREPEIRKNIELAMSRLDSELKDLDGKLRLESSERKRRIDYADQKWSKGDVKGSTTAKGRHYLRYGPPDEMETHTGKGENWLYRNWRGTGGKMIFEFDADGQLKR